MTDRQTHRQTDPQTDARGKTICLPTLAGGRHNNTNVDLVNDDVFTKFGLILSIRSQDIEQKPNSDVNQGP